MVGGGLPPTTAMETRTSPAITLAFQRVMYLKGRATGRDHGFFLQMATMARAEARSFIMVSHTGAGPQTLHHLLLPQASSRAEVEVDRRWSSWDLHWHPRGKPASGAG